MTRETVRVAVSPAEVAAVYRLVLGLTRDNTHALAILATAFMAGVQVEEMGVDEVDFLLSSAGDLIGQWMAEIPLHTGRA